MNPEKFIFYDNCIFCNKPLASEAEREKGDGEHVFPKNIFGFWKSRDVCPVCMKYFGDNIDNLTLSNSEILNAMKKLGLTERDYIEGQEFIGEDIFNNHRQDFIVKNNKPRIRNIKTDDFFQVDEANFEKAGYEWIKQDRKKYMEKEKLEMAIKQLKNDFDKTTPGETVENNILQVKIRKSQAIIVETKSNTKSLIPLVAKIATIFLKLTLPEEDLIKLDKFKKIRDYSIGIGNIEELDIYRCISYDEEEYFKYHFIKMQIVGNFIVVFVVFFGYISFCINFVSTEDIKIFTQFNEEQIERYLWCVDFDSKYKIVWVMKDIKGNTNAFEKYYS